MRTLDVKIINYLVNSEGHKIDTHNLCLHEASKLPRSTNSLKIEVNPINNPTYKFSKGYNLAKTIDFETNNYNYYEVVEYPVAGGNANYDKATYYVRIPKKEIKC